MTKATSWCILALALLLAVHSANCRLVLVTNNGTETFYAPSMYFPESKRTIAPLISARLIYEPIVSARNATNAERYSGSIVFIKNWDEPVEANLFLWMEEACKTAAVLILPYGPDDSGLGYPEFALPSTYNVNVSCPTLTISIKSSARLIELVAQYPNLTATIDKDDGISPVRQWLGSGLYWFFSVFSAASSCFVAAYAVVKLYEYCYCAGRPVFSVVGICILLELCGSFIRFTNWSIDSLGARHLTTQHGSGSWRSASLPFTVASTLLLTFYWHETLSRTSLRVSLNVGKFKIPCYILIVTCFLVEIVVDTIRLTLHNISNFWRSINAVFYVIVAAGLSVFYIVTAIRIFIALKKSALTTNHSNVSNNSVTSNKKESRRLTALRSTTIKLLGSGIFLAIMVVVAPTSLLPYYASASMSHVGYPIFWIVAHFLVNGKAVTTLAAFPTSQKGANTSANRSTALSDKSHSGAPSHISADT